jgi:hypothetical protein
MMKSARRALSKSSNTKSTQPLMLIRPTRASTIHASNTIDIIIITKTLAENVVVKKVSVTTRKSDRRNVNININV